MERSNLSEYVDGKLFPVSLKIGDNLSISHSSLQGLSNHLNSANRLLASRRSNYRFRKITAERDIQPEQEGELILHSNGAGASNLIAAFLNDSKLEESIIEYDFLNALNSIMQPEAEFESIRVHRGGWSRTGRGRSARGIPKSMCFCRNRKRTAYKPRRIPL